MYDFGNTYLVIDNDKSRVWSKKADDYVFIDDAEYVEWRRIFLPMQIANEQQLWSVLNAPIITQIVELETRQARPLREISLGLDVTANQLRLTDLDAEIAALRGSLHAESNA